MYSIENKIKMSEKLPQKVKISLEKGKIIQNDWNNYSLNSLINDCINIENYIRDINIINKIIYNDDYNFYFNQNTNINLIENIENIGKINYKNTYFFLINNFWKSDDYKITGDNCNIMTKQNNYLNNNYVGAICEG